MNLIKVRFTEWRDAKKEKTPTELDMVQIRLSNLRARETELKTDFARMVDLRKAGDSDEMKAEHMALAVELDNLIETERAAHAAQTSLGEDDAKKMKQHAKADSFGYQVLDDSKTLVLKIVDASGADLPAGSVYGYEVVDAAPVLPGWALIV